MSNPSPLSGQRLGAYEVGPLIGAGGMGEVYRARDTKLHRDVAIKVLLPAVAGDAERLARFSREAQVLASLNHPGIAHIHGLEESDSGPFLVMELVEGPTLADRIAQGPLPVDEATTIARQIAEALEAAHERGVIHRDLKPANIKVCDDGTVKVLDFGLAKALDPASVDGAQAANSPTITTPAMTQAGIILGTAAYMSPEQAKGRVVDKRTDIWAFGCVFYEMLTARRAFDGEDVTDTIAAVVRGQPDWSALPHGIAPHIKLLLARCLEKDRRARIADISVAGFLLNEQITAVETADRDTQPLRRESSWRKAAVAALLGVIVGGAAVFAVVRMSSRPASSAPARFMVTPSSALPLAVTGNDRDVAIAPDGSFIVYRSADSPRGRVQLILRRMRDLEGSPISGTAGESARAPVISPDGQWVAFASGSELRKVPVTGGPPTTICKLRGAMRGASWGDDGHIVLATSDVSTLQRVDADGGEPQPIGTAAEGMTHRYPFVMPGSRLILFTATTGAIDTATLEALNLDDGQQKTLIPGAHNGAFLNGGVLVFTVTASGGEDSSVRGTLRAVRFDPRQATVIGTSVVAVDDIALSPTGFANYAISVAGDIVYVPGGTGYNEVERRTLVWVDRHGRETPLAAPARAYATARISPDGAKVVVDARDQTNDIWIWDLKRETLTPLNRDPGQDMSPLWMPDGRRIVWTSTRNGTTPNLYWQSADGTGTIERLTIHASNQFPTSVSPDGSKLVVFGYNAAQQLDLFSIDLRATDRKQQTLVSFGPSEMGGEISPDGRWLAYHSNESGEFEVYVRPFPNVQDGRWPISNDGGTRAAWSRRGDELFYIDRRGLLTAVGITASATSFTASVPKTLLKTAYHSGVTRLGLDLRSYDIAPDGQRILMIKDSENPASRPLAGMVMVLDWVEELKARLIEW